ncbi:hypothetical protein GCM10007937_24790 [Mesorhizobium albiziae]|nr:hypothetical protein GCM10007937_24790 [Mesorhizobium albiziae]
MIALMMGITVVVAACGEDHPPPGANSDTKAQQPPAQSGITDTAPQQDADPTPETGTGGDQQII